MSDFCVVRQPVFSRDSELIGYEIRFRDTPEGRDSFARSFLTGSFDNIRGDHPAFVPCGDAHFLARLVEIANPKTTIPLIPPHVGSEPHVMDLLERYCMAGGQIALDQLTTTPDSSDALLPYAHWVRIDVRLDDVEALARTVERARVNREVLLIADHVYDPGQFAVARNLGFDAYEGSYFSRPEPLPRTELPSSTISALRLMGQARDPNVQDRALEDAIATDPVLTFQLLRIVNSASVGARGVTSIGHALRLIGRHALLRWLAVAIAASRRGGTDLDAHLVRQAVERARLCEMLSGTGRDAGTLFLVGLFSLLDAVFRLPIEELVDRVALSDEAKDALLERSGPYAEALNFAESYELGMFESAAEAARTMGVDPAQIGEIYTGALSWTSEILEPIAADAGRAA